jgi:hypothetical protein
MLRWITSLEHESGTPFCGPDRTFVPCVWLAAIMKNNAVRSPTTSKVATTSAEAAGDPIHAAFVEVWR